MRILLTPAMQNPDFESDVRTNGLAALGKFGTTESYPADLTQNEAQDVIAVIANSQPIHDSFYDTAKDLRIISRWGVGFENVNQKKANEVGVIITTSPVHMDTVAEYTIAQWTATLKRTYTLNHLSHGGDFSLIRTFDIEGGSLGLFGFGRIGQAEQGGKQAKHNGDSDGHRKFFISGSCHSSCSPFPLPGGRAWP